MFTDIEGSTNLISTRGFTESHEIMKAYETIVDEKVAEHAGRRIKGLGDGLMVSFGSSRHGVECALDIQRAIAEYSKQNPERKVRIRIGLNTGEVVEEAGDIFGAAVNVAARVAGKAKGGEILVSDVVRQLVGPGGRDRLRLPRRIQAEGLPRPVAAARGHAGRDDVDHADRRCRPATVSSAATRSVSTSGWCSTAPSTGSGGMLFIAGAPGIGASRLAAEVAADAARKGWMVLSGRCAEQAARPVRPVPRGARCRGRGRRREDAAGGGRRERPAARAAGARAARRRSAACRPPSSVTADKLREQLFHADLRLPGRPARAPSRC